MRRLAAVPLILAVLAACGTSPFDADDLYTYVVRYAVSGTIAAPVMDVTYTTGTAGTSVTANVTALPWAIELPMDYDYSDAFTPQMRVWNTSLADGESVTLTVSWKDYKVDFAEEVLAARTVSIASGGPTAQDIPLYGPPLPQ